MLDSLREIFASIKKNRLRTFLTSFAVAWGIFMLIILLAVGNGVENGITSNFAGRAQNMISVFPGWTSIPYGGLPVDRSIQFNENDYRLISEQIPQVEYVSPRITQSTTLSYGDEYGSWTLIGVTPDLMNIYALIPQNENSRFINKIDMDERRKVIVLNSEIKKILFKDEDPMGKYVKAGELVYQVIGVYDLEDRFQNNPPAYIPFTTAQILYNQGYGFRRIDFTVQGLNTIEKNDEFNKQLRQKLGMLHNFDPNDMSAVFIRNTAERSIQTKGIFTIISIFIIVIGAASLMAGIVGVGNIMLITVKERTREIGIRKAIGATPISILRLIMFESVFITTVAGYVGMVLGIIVTELLSAAIAMGGGSSDGPSMFKDPTVDMVTVLLSTLVLIVCGVVAGLIPAIKATKVSPIEAMRAE